MNKIKFVLGIHNHQPIGNFDFVFEEAYQKSYLPFLQILRKHPKIRISIHYTGILLDWLEQNHPELLAMIREMTASGQLEIMSGGYYEPIISVIPEQDRKGQILKLTERVKDLFGYQASGMWLAERIWEPTLPSTLHDAGIKYTVIDDTHFKYAGLTDKELFGYYLSEDLGKSVALFPISKQLRYTIPFQDPDETIKVLRYAADKTGQNILVFADDGEKFGVWPETFRHVYENKWLDRFFTAIENNMDWLEMLHFDEVNAQVLPKNKIYLPTASYAEMMHWALFPETFRQYEDFEHYVQEQGLFDRYGIFIRGGFWRNFMTKYPEINIMHKKMLRVSRKLWNTPAGQRKKLAKAFDHLWAGQCNCPYWHGVFGGAYLSHLRHAIFNNVIDAEKIFDQLNPMQQPLVERSDFDVDGREEVLVETPVHNAYFKPDRGAALFEYDFKPASKNILDTMTRREEGYHHKLSAARLADSSPKPSDGGKTASIHDLVLTKEPGLAEFLNYDWYEKKSFIDHFLGTDVTLDNFSKAAYTEEGDFVNQPYQLENHIVEADQARLQFIRQGNVWLNGDQKAITVRKYLTIMKDQAEITANYLLVNSSGQPLNVRFAVEFNFGLQAGHAHDRYYYDKSGRLPNSYLDSRIAMEKCSFIGLRDEYMKIDVKLDCDKPATIWRMPVETISLSEAGFERVYQSSTVLLIWNIQIKDNYELKIRHRVDSL
jgi:alpha-amylase